MIRVLAYDVIERAVAGIDLLPLMEAGFAAYSAGRCNIPPVGELVLEKGEVHIKYGCIKVFGAIGLAVQDVHIATAATQAAVTA